MRIEKKNIKGGVDLLEPIMIFAVFVIVVSMIITGVHSYRQSVKNEQINDDINNMHLLIKKGESTIKEVDDDYTCAYILSKQKSEKWETVKVNGVSDFKDDGLYKECSYNKDKKIVLEFQR